jgi:thiol-disulfide isomerase/thioredoxin
MKQNSIIILSSFVVALLAGTAGYVVRHSLNVPSSEIVPAGSLLTTQLPDLSDKPQSLKQWQGKILILNFWATWCPPCLTEIPEFIVLQKQYADKNVQFIGIAVDEKQAVLDYNASAKVNYPLLIAGDGGIGLSKAWGNTIESVPFTVVLNPEGEIIYRQLGEVHQAELLKVIQPLLKTR